MKAFNFLKWFLRAKYFWVFKSRNALLTHQEKHLKYYKEHLENYGFFENELLENFKIKHFSKEYVQNNFEKFNKYHFNKDYCIKEAYKNESGEDSFIKELSFGLSSGTSGSRGVFISSKEEQIIWAAIILGKMLPNKMVRKIFNPFSSKLKISLFLRANNNLYKSVNKFGLSLSFFDLNKNINESILQLTNTEVDILVAPASVILFLAQKIEKKEIVINPKLIISVAEVLEKKEYISKIFNQKIHEIYQCTEGLLAYTCLEGNIHLNESFVKFERKEIDHKRFIPIITDFTRKTQFYNNYLHEDILVKGNSKCSCGDASLTLEKIEGRQDEILKFNDKLIFPDAIRKLFFSTKNEIKNFIIKKNHNNLTIYLDPNEIEVTNEVKLNLNSLLKENGIEYEKISYNFLNYERNLYSIKNKRIFNLE